MKLKNLYFFEKMFLNCQNRHLFDMNKSTATNHIKFKRLPRQSLLKYTLKRFLNHSNKRYLQQKIYQKTAINKLNSYQNLSQQLYLSYNYKLFQNVYFKSRTSSGTSCQSKLTESREGKEMSKGTFFIINKI